MKRFQVIGGSLHIHRYGESDTLRGAKMIASKWGHTYEGGLYKPSIYLTDDCEKESPRNFTNPTGIVPKKNAQPVSVWDGKTWEDFSPVFGEI